MDMLHVDLSEIEDAGVGTGNAVGKGIARGRGGAISRHGRL